MESKGKPERAPRPTVALMYHALAGVDERGQDPHYTLSEAAFRQHLTQILVHHGRSEEHTSELQSLMRISYAVFCLKKKKIRIETLLLLLNHSTLVWRFILQHIHVYMIYL